jgi:hypothetical protein
VLAIDCRRDEQKCAVEARYCVENPATAREDAITAFCSPGTTDVAMSVDGASCATPLTSGDRTALVLMMQRMLDERDARDVPFDGCRFGVEPGGHATLVARGRIDATHFGARRGAEDAIHQRHPLLTDRRHPLRKSLRYALAPIRTWAAERATIEISIAYSRNWELVFDENFAIADVGGAWMASRTFTLPTMPNGLDFEFAADESSLPSGGFLVGIGAATGGETRGFRVRAGYEIALASGLHLGLVGDSDLRKSVLFAPQISLVSGALYLIPSFSIGVGVPIEITPAVRSGVRFQADAMLHWIGVVYTLDIFAASDGPTIRSTLLAQASF